MNIQDRFFDVMPLRRKSSTDWVLPAALGLGVGIAFGVGIGLLYAPSTGEDARHRLREGASRVKEKAADFASRAKHQIASTVEQQERRIHS